MGGSVACCDVCDPCVVVGEAGEADEARDAVFVARNLLMEVR
jgi:hypothetical protein